MLAHPHRLVSRLPVATSAATLSQPRCSRVTLVPPSTASKRTSTSVPSSACPPSRYSSTRRTPDSHTVIRPTSSTSPIASSYTSSQRPPTPGSIRLPTAREASYQLIGPGLHQRSISTVKISNALTGSTATSTLAVTASVAFMHPLLSEYARHEP